MPDHRRRGPGQRQRGCSDHRWHRQQCYRWYRERCCPERSSCRRRAADHWPTGRLFVFSYLDSSRWVFWDYTQFIADGNPLNALSSHVAIRLQSLSRRLHIRLVLVLIIGVVTIAVSRGAFFDCVEYSTFYLDAIMTEALERQFDLLDRVQTEAGNDEAGARQATNQRRIGDGKIGRAHV